jgi:hypothetical protein
MQSLHVVTQSMPYDLTGLWLWVNSKMPQLLEKSIPTY